jgi:hypothetical protein
MRRPSVPLLAAAAAAVAAALVPAAGHGQQPATETIATVAGTGVAAFADDGGPATAAGLALPSDVAPLADGGYLIADTANHRIRRVGPDGTIATVAGAGPGAPAAGAYAGDGVPATSADVRLNQPRGVAVRAGGGFLIADTGNHVIRHVGPNGAITTVAGQPGVAGAGTGATNPRALLLNAPQGVAGLPDGGFLIADTGNHRIVRVDGSGAVTVVAGTGTDDGPLGDGGPATRAILRLPARVVTLAGGGFLIADTGQNRVRRVDTDGRITTVAGSSNEPGFAGDGGPATSAQLNAPEGIAVRAGGAIAIADTGNQRIREVAADGTIRTIAGTGVAGFSGDGGAPAAAQLALPRAVATGAGLLLVADTGNQRVRAISTETAPEPPEPQGDQAAEPPVPPLPPGVAAPRFGRSAVIAPLSGTVRVRLPGRRRFVRLDEARNVGVGAELDTTRGRVAVFFTTNRRGRGASAVASLGRFRLLQPNVRFLGERPGLLALSAPLRGCGTAAQARASATGPTATAAARKRRERRLRVRAKGRIRTKGKYGSAIVIGTEWTITDRCRPGGRNTTTVKVSEGVVQVRDFVRHRSVRVRRGLSYVARARLSRGG